MAGSDLSSLDVAMATSPLAKPLPTRADLAWERAILRKSSRPCTPSPGLFNPRY
ncbi:hypothetical protein HY003_01750 [Candidatus Saccharibacteria bacterium]|nr:hypothetical protein [Candidatus Saccharibacteria bacterium]MBI3337999.1 hypothetical protein [Candidatus Saccharibacteria bacterium]